VPESALANRVTGLSRSTKALKCGAKLPAVFQKVSGIEQGFRE